MAADEPGTPPPLQHLPTSKEKKYDRQLRLWAASGQQALEDAHILLINSGPGVTGIEALKNLVLPGIGQFTIQDAALVTEADLGVNFFLDENSLNSLRAAETCRFLQELNPDVKGNCITEPLAGWITGHGVLQPYSLIVIASPIAPDVLAIITEYAQQHGVPVFYLHSVGFYSHFSVSLASAFPIVDTHPDPTSTQDLRLLTPWPALTKFADDKAGHLDTLSPHDLGHVPYVLLLLHFLQAWKDSHGGSLPSSYKEKTEFRETVRSAGPPDEENFSEAAGAVLKSLNPPTASSSVLAVLDAPEAQSLTATSPSFWYVAQAVHTFYQTHKELPLSGALPDMKARSEDYITLQNIYKAKARQDVAEVGAMVHALEKKHQRPSNLSIPVSEVEAFCKNAPHIKLVRGRPTALLHARDPLHWDAESAKSAVNALMMPDSGILIYLAFVAYDNFVGSHNTDGLGGTSRVPGSRDADVQVDGDKVVATAEKILDHVITAAGTFVENPGYDEAKVELGQVCREIVRAGGAELHNIASLTGGMVAQEVIKVITKQYVPIDNTCVFDGVASKSGVFRV